MFKISRNYCDKMIVQKSFKLLPHLAILKLRRVKKMYNRESAEKFDLNVYLFYSPVQKLFLHCKTIVTRICVLQSIQPCVFNVTARPPASYSGRTSLQRQVEFLLLVFTQPGRRMDKKNKFFIWLLQSL